MLMWRQRGRLRCTQAAGRGRESRALPISRPLAIDTCSRDILVSAKEVWNGSGSMRMKLSIEKCFVATGGGAALAHQLQRPHTAQLTYQALEFVLKCAEDSSLGLQSECGVFVCQHSCGTQQGNARW